jgi:hypothetical protein
VVKSGLIDNYSNSMVASNDAGAEVATLLTRPAWSGRRAVELGSIATADEVAEQLGEVLNRDMKAFAVPRAGWANTFEQFGIPKGHTGPAEEMFEAANAGWMDLGVEGTEHVAGTTSGQCQPISANVRFLCEQPLHMSQRQRTAANATSAADVERILELTQGYAYFPQEWGSHTWLAAKQSPILPDVVRQATTAIAALDESFFRVRFDRLTPKEKISARNGGARGGRIDQATLLSHLMLLFHPLHRHVARSSQRVWCGVPIMATPHIQFPSLTSS